MKTSLELIEFKTIDNVMLPGLLYNVEGDSIVISLHGNGSSGGLYNVRRNNILGKGFNKMGISYLTFSNRGSHFIQKFDRVNENGEREREEFGVAYELINECIYDIDGAVSYAKELGYKKIYLMGLSTGANKICLYDKLKKDNENNIFGYILLSGGDDTGLFYESVGDIEFKNMMDLCKRKIGEGKGRELVPGDMIISYQSLLDQIDPDGEYNIFPFFFELNKIKLMHKEPFIEFKNLKRPTLIIYGDKDEYCYGRVHDCIELLKKVVNDKKGYSFRVLKDANHNFEGKNEELLKSILDWINK